LSYYNRNESRWKLGYFHRSMEKYKNIVILGGGFGGVRTALSLSKKLKGIKDNNYRIVVVDKKEYHTFTPLLYEIATTSEQTANDLQLKHFVTYNLKHILRDKHISVVEDTVLYVDINGKSVNLKYRSISFEYLVIALGAETNYFDIQGLKKYALPLKTFNDAITIRNAIETATIQKDRVKIIIGGGGPTGVELAGEIKSWGRELTGELHKKCAIDITIVDDGPMILSMFHQKIAMKAKKRLEKFGVKIMTGKRITEITKTNVILDDAELIPYNICVWTGGVKATTLTSELPVQYEKRGRIEITEALECIASNPNLNVCKNIYAIGDIACVYNPKTKQPTPLMARPAIVEGKIVAKNIIEKIKYGEKAKIYTYKPKNYPYIIPVGGKYAIAKIGPFTISGILGWIFKGIVELEYFMSILPFSKALKMWFRGFLIFIKNDKLG